MLEQPMAQQEEPDAWSLRVSMPCSTCQDFVSWTTSSDLTSSNGISRAETRPSFVPAAKDTASGSKTGAFGVCVMCPCSSVPSPCGCMSDGSRARIAPIGRGSNVRHVVIGCTGPTGCPIQCVRNVSTVAPARSLHVAMACQRARCFVGPWQGAGADTPASWAALEGLMHTPGARDIAGTRSSWTRTTVDRSRR
jgi:hypothetical protein